MKDMNRLKDMLCEHLEEYNRAAKLSGADIEMIHKLTDTIKNIGKIEMLEDGTYSHAGDDWEARGSYRGGDMMPGTSQRRQRRDSRGRYSREGGGSYRESGYSYDDGMEELHELLEDLEKGADERMKNAIYRFKQEIRR